MRRSTRPATLLYWVVAGGDDDAVWRLSLADGTRDRLFVFPPDASAARGIGLAAYVTLTAQVALSEDGERLAATRCRQNACELAVMDLPGGDPSWYRAGAIWQSLLGFADGGVSLVSQCIRLPDGTLVDDCGALDARAAAGRTVSQLDGQRRAPGWLAPRDPRRAGRATDVVPD